MSLSEVLKALVQKNCESITASDMAVLVRSVLKLKRSGIVENSIQAGETVPNITLPDNQYQAKTLYDLLQKSGPVVVTFFRGTWCSFCQAQLNAFESALDELEKMNVSFIAISPNAISVQNSEQHNYIKINDIDNAIAHDFRLVYELEEEQQSLFSRWKYNLAGLNGSQKWELPVPSTFLIDTDRRVKFRYMNVDFRQRIDPKEVIDVVREKLR